MKPTYLSKLLLVASMMLGLMIWSCEPEVLPSIPPTANLDFLVTTQNFQPLQKARIYLFPFKGNYDSYLQDNPEGKASILPTLNERNIGETDSVGQYIFANYELQGNEYVSGNTWFHRPDPIYYRIEASLIDGGDTLFLTNDGLDNILSFEELENGAILFEEIEAILE